MDSLLSKLTNLGYEMFGIIIPGFAGIIALLVLVHVAGPLVPFFSNAFMEIPRVNQWADWVDNLSSTKVWLLLLSAFCVAYYVGHVLKWLSRNGESLEKISNGKRFWGTLTFRIPKPITSYHSSMGAVLHAMYNSYEKKSELKPDWRSFYPLAKIQVMHSGKPSLISTYQNKYTFHRSLSLLAALTFWLALVIFVISIVCAVCFQIEMVRWIEIILIIAFSLVGVHYFSSSYEYTWKLWGDSVIAESFVLTYLSSSSFKEIKNDVKEQYD